jgi:hypothetical protein
MAAAPKPASPTVPTAAPDKQFNGDVIRELAAQFLALAEKQGATVPLMIGHRLMGNSLT